jgi:ABC-type branched-subunit amino acid transport system substrate-binding protein
MRTTFVVGAAALSVLLTGCGGTRQSDEAIEKAAGVGAGQQAATTNGALTGDLGSGSVTAPTDTAGATAGAPTGTTGAGSATAPGTATSTGGAGAPATGSKGNAGSTATGGNTAGGNAGAAAGPVTKKTVIKLGAVGTFSGPVGGLVKDTVTGIRAWSQAVNAAGGINGHPVEVLVGDDGGDPARFNSILQQFVEQQGVQAFLYTTLGFAPNGNNKYLDAKHIFTFAHEGGLEIPYTDPYVLTPAPAGLTYADVMVLSFGAGINAKGGVKLASFACSDFGLCDNFDKRWSDKNVLQKAGFTLVARGRPSLTQPDYTSQCLAAKQAGAEAIILALDGAAIRRFASDCARQNYHPKLSSADLVITRDLPGDKNVDGLVIGTKMAPFTDARVPGINEMLQAFARFAPGQTPTGGMSYGWLIGNFFQAAAKNLPDHQTLKDIEDGVYSIKNNNLKGMTFPITMTRGKPMARQLCYGTALVQGDHFATAPGKSFSCAKDGKPLSNPDDYGAVTGSVQPASVQQGDVVQGAATRAALRASAPSSSDAWLPALGEETYGVLVPQPRVAASARSASPARVTADAPACPPARAAGFSYLLDAFQTGTSAGPGVFYGIALAVLGTPVPAPFDTYQAQFLGESASFVEKFSHDTPAAIQAARQYFEPFAVYNDYSNAFIDAIAAGLDGGADNFGSFIQPGDTSMKQLADSFRDAKATSSPCDVVVKPSGDKVVDALAKALANGDSKKAIALLGRNGLNADTARLGQAVYYAGIATADANTYEKFITATSTSFVDGGVSPMATGQAFQAAASQAFQTGLTPEMGAIGFRTICETYARYFAKGKFS